MNQQIPSVTFSLLGDLMGWDGMLCEMMRCLVHHLVGALARVMSIKQLALPVSQLGIHPSDCVACYCLTALVASLRIYHLMYVLSD